MGFQDWDTHTLQTTCGANTFPSRTEEQRGGMEPWIQGCQLSLHEYNCTAF